VKGWETAEMRNRRNWKTNLGCGLVISIAFTFWIPILAASASPGILVRDWQFFLPFVIVPLVVGVVLLVLGERTT